MSPGWAKCLSRSPLSGHRCTRIHGHDSDHQFAARGCEPTERWLRSAHDFDTADLPAIDTLYDLARSLSAYCAAAGFPALACELDAAVVRYQCGATATAPAKGEEDRS